MFLHQSSKCKMHIPLWKNAYLLHPCQKHRLIHITIPFQDPLPSKTHPTINQPRHFASESIVAAQWGHRGRPRPEEVEWSDAPWWPSDTTRRFAVSTRHVVTCRYVTSSVFCRFFFLKVSIKLTGFLQNEVGGKEICGWFFGRFIDILMIPETPWLVCLPPASPKSDDPPNIRSGNYVYKSGCWISKPTSLHHFGCSLSTWPTWYTLGYVYP